MPELNAGYVLGQYKVLHLLGEGGMASVYLAERREDGEKVAVKVMETRASTSPEFIKRFEREARLMAALQHPYILPVYDFGEQEGYAYLAMKAISGGDLREYVQQKPFVLETRLTLLSQLAGALDYAHQAGVIHRDLKPANVLMSEDEHPYLSDFGIAKFKEESVGLTATGMIVGTPSYMAPEQWRSETLDHRTDVYAFGVMTFEILAGQLPFQGSNPFTLMYAHLDEPPPPISRYQPNIPRNVDRILNRALAKIPEYRYNSVSALVEALQEAFREEAWDEASDDKTMHLRDFPTPRTLPDPKPKNKQPLVDPDRTTLLHGFDQLPTRDQKMAARPEDQPTRYAAEPEVETGYNSVDVGVRAILERAREAAREMSGENAVLAAAVIPYVQELRDLAKQPLNVQPTPYRALESYDIRDNKVFFGREVAISAMLERSPFARLTVLHAESGSGKTSLLRAGLMPRLLAGGYLPLYIAVRRTPPHEAVKSLLLPDASAAPELATASLRTYLKALSAVVGSNRQIFLFIDQFETFFSDVFTQAERSQFISELAECLDDTVLPIRVTLAMRTEFFGMLASFQPQVSQPFANEFLLRALKPEEAERALVLPAEAHGYTYEDGLPQQILADLGGTDQEIAPPQLQLVGGALIDMLPADRRLITLADYEQAGRAEGVLRSYLERLLERFNPADRRLARLIIEGLVRADQTRDVRTDASLRNELAALDAPTDHFDMVLNTLRENRVLRLVELEHERAYELVHDYLALQVQLDPETAARKAAQELLDRRVSDFENYGSLLTDQELAVITAQERNLHLSTAAHILIHRTQAARLRQRRIVTGLITAAIIGLVGILGLGLFAAVREGRNRQARLELAQTSEAQVAAQAATAVFERDRANEQTLISQSGQVALQSLLEMNSLHLDRAFLLSVQARQIYDTRDARSSLLTILQNAPQLDRFLYTHPDWVRTVVHHPTSDQFVSADAQGNVILWDGATLTPIWEQSLDEGIWSMALSHDGMWLVTADNDGQLTRWDMLTGEYQSWVQYEEPIFSVAISPDDRLIASGHEDGTIRLWEAATQTILHEYAAHTDTVHSLAFSPDSTLLASGSRDQTIALTDVRGVPTDSRWLRGHTNWVYSVAFSPDGQTLASGSTDNTLRLWDIEAGTLRVPPLTDHRDWIRTVIYSADGQWLITGSRDNTIIIRDAATGQRLDAFPPLIGHSEEVHTVALNPQATRLISGDETGRLLIWSLSRQQLISDILGTATSDLTASAVHPQQEIIYAGGADRQVQAWEINTGETVGQPMPASSQINTIAISPNGQTIAYGDGGEGSGNIYLWENNAESPYATIPAHVLNENVTAVRSLAFSPDGKMLVSGGDDGLVKLWEVATGTQIGDALAGHTDWVMAVSFTPDGQFILSGGQDHRMIVWEAASQTQANELPAQHTEAVVSLTFSPDGRWLVSGSRDRTAVVWDWAQRQPFKTLIGHTEWVVDAAFNQAGTLLATAGRERESNLILWDTATWQRIGEPLQGHSHWAWTVNFSQDDRWLLSTSRDATVRRWSVDPAQWATWACEIANREISEGEWAQYLPFAEYAPTCHTG